MPVDVLVPPLGTTVDTLTLIEWYKLEGDSVVKDEPLFAVETDKATLDVEAPVSGVLQRVTAAAGDSITALTRIAVIAAVGESLSDAAPSKAVRAATLTPSNPPSPLDRHSGATTVTRARPDKQRIFISPRAKRLAVDHNLEWRVLTGTGPEGAIVERDVRTQLNRPQSAVTLTMETNATGLVSLYEQLGKLGVAATYDDLLLRIVARALLAVPAMACPANGAPNPKTLDVHIGLTIEVGDEFQLVVISDVNKKSLSDLALETRKLREAVQAGQVASNQKVKASVALTNLGKYGIDLFSSVIPIPDCPVLGVGRIQPRSPGSEYGSIMWISLTFDPRTVGAVAGSRFLQAVGSYIENPVLALA